jgi:hypothetical protein
MTTPYPSAGSGPGRRLDVAPLLQPIETAQLDAFISESKAANQPWTRVTTGLRRPGVGDVISQLIPVVIPTIGVLAIVMTGGRSLISAVWRFTFEAPFPLNLVIVGFVVLIALGVLMALLRVISIIRSLIVPRSWWEAAFRLVGFARANDLRYGHDETASHPGVIFGTGTDRTVERRLTTTAGRRVEIGNYRYVERSSDNDNVRVYGWGYVAIQLDRRLPHLLLDAKQNNTSVFGIRSSNLPVDLAPDQRLTLGGEFDEKFTLYAPRDYGRDAFQIFAPDLMALFIDRLGTFDVEIVDDTMFCYGGRFDLLDPTTYAWLQELVDTVVARTVRRTSRYRDDFALLETDPAGASAIPPSVPPSSPPSMAQSMAPFIPQSTPQPTPQSTDPAAGSAAAGPQAGFQLFPGFVLGAGGVGGVQPAGGSTPATGAAPPRGPVFTFAGDGPAETASNAVASGGRRLRRRTWGFWSIVAILVVLLYLYNSFLAPLFGWPHLIER